MKLVADFMVDIPQIKLSDTVTKARQVLRDDVFREIYVYDDRKRLAGYVDLTDVLRVTATKSNVTVEGYLKEAASVTCDTPIEEAVRAIKKYRTDSACVVDGQMNIKGGVLLSDLFPIIITRHELHGSVSDYMSRKVVTSAPDDPVQKIHSLIIESSFTAFPVVKKNKIVGIISRRDILKAGRIRAALESGTMVAVDTLMSKDVVTVSPDEPIQAAAALMVRHDIGRVPVVDSGRIRGILDRHDVLKGLAMS
ncbi:MAG TPA: CBS domain-containing protein [Methanoregulaceae archaeon]|nr:CBS domain-containing protein [Methanoregulaceae archaeon]